jgi:hypothetical protein
MNQFSPDGARDAFEAGFAAYWGPQKSEDVDGFISDMNKAWEEYAASLQPATPTAAAGDAAAWQKRWRADPSTGWKHVEPHHVEAVQGQGWEVRALYAGVAQAATPSRRDDELDPIEKIEPLQVEISGPYLYAGDKHPSLRLAAPDRIVASVYLIDGDEERAFAEASMIKEAFRLGGEEIDRLHYASGAAQTATPSEPFNCQTCERECDGPDGGYRFPIEQLRAALADIDISAYNAAKWRIQRALDALDSPDPAQPVAATPRWLHDKYTVVIEAAAMPFIMRLVEGQASHDDSGGVAWFKDAEFAHSVASLLNASGSTEACAKVADDFAAYEQTVIDRANADDALSETGRKSITSAAGARQVAAEQIAHNIRALAIP